MDTSTLPGSSREMEAEGPAPRGPEGETLAYGADVAALFDIARALAPHRTHRSPYISTTLLLFSLTLPAYSLDAKVRMDSPAAMEFGLALKNLAGAAFDTAWARYFRVDIGRASILEQFDGAPEFTRNAARWMELADRYARRSGRTAIAIDDVIQAFADHPPRARRRNPAGDGCHAWRTLQRLRTPGPGQRHPAGTAAGLPAPGA